MIEGALISPAEPADAEAIASLVNGAYRGAGAARGWTHEAELLDGQRTDPAALRDAMAAGCTILLWRESREAAPCGCVAVQAEKGTERWSLGMLTVDPTLQAAGLGRRLLRAAEDHGKARGGRLIEITVIHLRDSLIAWYERQGFVRTGETRPFPYGDDRAGVPRRADLHFVVLAKKI